MTGVTVKDSTVSYTAEGRVGLLSSEGYVILSLMAKIFQTINFLK